MNATNKTDPTIDAGVACYLDSLRGDGAKLDQFQKLYLTAKGQRIMRKLTATDGEAQIRKTIAAAVRAGY